jgi:hypothetical protein
LILLPGLIEHSDDVALRARKGARPGGARCGLCLARIGKAFRMFFRKETLPASA